MMRKIGFVLTILLSFVLCGSLELVSGGFNLQYLETAEYWFKLVANLTANFIVLYTVADKDIVDSYEKNEEIVKNDKELKEAVETGVYPDFDEYLALENKNRKIVAWKAYIAHKIFKLEKKAKLKDNEVYWYGTDEEKAENKYCKKRKQLEFKMSDEYVNRNIIFIKIKYYKLKKYVVLTGCEQNSNEYKLTTNRSWKIINDNKYRFLISTAFTVFLSSFIPDMKDFTYATLIVFACKIFILTWNLFVGKNYAVSYQRNTILPDQKYRKDILTKYFIWRKNKQKEVKE